MELIFKITEVQIRKKIGIKKINFVFDFRGLIEIKN